MANIPLPPPEGPLDATLAGILQTRESRRKFGERALTLVEISFLLWSAGGTLPGFKGRKVPPSAGACYPLDLYLSLRSGGLEGVDAGVYIYDAAKEQLTLHADGDKGNDIAAACLNQKFIAAAPVVLVFAAEFARSTVRYGQRGVQYVFIDSGHAGQNVYLAAEALGLSTCGVGAFNDAELKNVLELPATIEPIYLFPIGARE